MKKNVTELVNGNSVVYIEGNYFDLSQELSKKSINDFMKIIKLSYVSTVSEDPNTNVDKNGHLRGMRVLKFVRQPMTIRCSEIHYMKPLELSQFELDHLDALKFDARTLRALASRYDIINDK